MEDDLEFLIGALSQPSPAQAMPYSGETVQEMREAFVALQKLLRSNQFQAAARAMPRSTAGGEARICPTGLSAEESPESELDSIATLCSSSDNGASASASLSSSEAISHVECKTTGCQSIWRRDIFRSWSSTFEYDTNSSDPEAPVMAQRLHSSTVSISLPVQLVCHSSHGPNSETTITPDGIRYSLAE
ncbi:GL26616 [Drosophila persimilis]|uniref:GL26616 n=1 Tax=Drosophila persimilis TaxID=7234 RepID=B4GSW7_DROPE|nr:GL26616 [Drosophila persimilis]